jgi:hypothetical protein
MAEVQELKQGEVVSEGVKQEDAGKRPRGQEEMVHAPHQPTRLEKILGVVRAALPIAQRVLPLIDGQIGTVVSSLIGPQVSPRQVAQTLLPLQAGLAELEKQQLGLRTQVAGQNVALKQIDEQLEAVKKLAVEAAEEQQRQAESLKKMARKVNGIAIAGLILLGAMVALNVVLFVQIRRVFP